MKPYSEACERNRAPILAVLQRVFADRHAVLEIGSGTGQHAVYFAPELGHLIWQPTDVAEHLPGIAMWVAECGAPNLRSPIELDVDRTWPPLEVDAVFSANTCHIMSWPQVERMFEGVGRFLPRGGVFALYGPFSYGGRHTSESNVRFDAMLRARDPESGVRDLDALVRLAAGCGLALEEDNAMPTNNRLLVWRSSTT
jgi:cyclopropane fatty-acyl-phospholipid synthase-like methyltransferase